MRRCIAVVLTHGKPPKVRSLQNCHANLATSNYFLYYMFLVPGHNWLNFTHPPSCSLPLVKAKNNNQILITLTMAPTFLLSKLAIWLTPKNFHSSPSSSINFLFFYVFFSFFGLLVLLNSSPFVLHIESVTLVDSIRS